MRTLRSGTVCSHGVDSGTRAVVCAVIIWGSVGVGIGGAAQVSAVTPSAADQTAIRQVLEEYLAAYSARDLDRVSALWVDGNPDSSVVRAIVADSRDRQTLFAGVRLAHWSVEGDGVGVRAAFEVAVTDVRMRRTEKSVAQQTYRFVRRGEAWRIAREESTVYLLARELRDASDRAARVAILDREPDLVGERLRIMLQSMADQMPEGAGPSRAAPEDPGAPARERVGRDPVALVETALEVAVRTGNRAGAAATLAHLGVRHQLSRRWTESVEAYTRALTIYRDLGDRARQASTEVGLAGVFYTKQDREAAREHYQAALAIFTELADADAIASTEHSLGNVAYLQQDWIAALDHYGKSIAAQETAATAAGGPATEARKQAAAGAYQGIGMVHQELGDYEAAVTAYETSLTRYTASSDTTGMINVHEAFGRVYRLARNHALALQHLMAAHRLYQTLHPRLKDRDKEARLFTEIGEVYALEQRSAAALDYFGRGLAIYEGQRDTRSIVAVLGGIGGVHQARGDHAQALVHFRRALTLAETTAYQEGIGFALLRIGIVHSAQARVEEALARFERAATVLQGVGKPRLAAAALVQAATMLNALGRSAEALESTARSLALVARLDAPDIVAQGHLVAGEARRRQGDRERARVEIQRAIDLVTGLRVDAVADDTERFFTDDRAPLLAMVDLLVEMAKPDEAFEVAERAHQWWVQDLLEDPTVVSVGMTPDMRRDERRLRNEAAQFARQLRIARASASPPPERIATLERGLAETRARRRVFGDLVRAVLPTLQALRARGPDLTAADVGRVLEGRAVLLVYAVGEARTHLFVLSQGSAVRVHTIEIAALDLERRIVQFRDLIVRQADQVGPAARALYDLLVKPADLQVEGAGRLLVVPDGALWALPFQALQPADGRYLIADRAVAYGASVAALVTAQEAGRRVVPGRPSRGRILSMGVAAPDAAGRERLLLSRPDLRFDPLLNAEEEARGVVAGLPATEGRSLTGANAVASRFRAEAPTSSTLHLAVPGIVDNASPLHSLLVMGPEEGGGDSGLVSAVDIMSLEHGARLAVLSRMYGDPALENPGAGAAMLAWAWLVSGAPSVVVAQWMVDDAGSAVLMKTFHGRLRAASVTSRPRPSEALRAAAVALLGGPFGHPYYWAGFTVFGDVR